MASLRRRALTLVFAVGIGVLAVPDVSHADDAQTYVVVPGDTLIGIASKSGIRLSALLQANDLRLTSLILPGQRLDIPAASSPSTTPNPSSSNTPAPNTSSPNASAASGGSSYVVRWGDTLSGIAQRNGVTLSALLNANQLSITSLIMPGRTLQIPGASAPAPSTGSSSTASASTSQHVVRPGDTLSGIAARYGVSLSSLLQLNSMSLTSLIMPGMSLALPAAANTPSPSGASGSGGTSSSATGVAAVVDYALAQVGKPYRFFSKGPDTFDCSGLTLAAYARIGIDLVHYSAYQARQGTAVDFHSEPIRAGDLVFQARRGSTTVNHVGIAVSSTTWVQAVGTGQTVRVGPLPAASTIDSVRRFVGS